MTSEQEVGKAFRRMLPNVNIATPEIIKYGREGNSLYEVSHGYGIDGEDIYGVTVLKCDKYGNPLYLDTDSCMLFNVQEDAETYAGELE